MRLDGTSTYSFSLLTRVSAQSAQRSLAEAQIELATGRHADIGVALGHRTASIAAMRAELDEISAREQRLKLAASKADVTQTVLDQIGQQLDGLVSTLTAARGAENGQEMARAAASMTSDAVASLLNTTFGGSFVFGGRQSQDAPLQAYSGSGAKAAIDDAILSGLGIEPSAVTPQQLSGFLQGAFSSQFSESAWQANWTGATADVPAVRLGNGQEVPAAASADSDPMRKAFEAMTMLRELSQDQLSQGAFEVLIDRSLQLLAEAGLGIGHMQARVGLGEAAISAGLESDSVRSGILNAAVADEESVDPYETSVRINQLMSQLEASYTVTGRLQQLSLIDFI